MVTRVLGLVLAVVVLGSDAAWDSRKGARQVAGSAANTAHRQFQQFQIGFQLPPGTQIHQGSYPPPAQPGFVWVQVPASSPPGQQGGYPQPPQTGYPPPSQPPQQPQQPGYPGAFPPPQQPSPIGGDTFQPPPPPTYPVPAPVPPYPGNQPIRPDSDFETGEVPEGPGSELNPGQETGVENPSPLLKYCLSARGQFPSPDNCGNFINCWDDTVAEQQCPGGLVFNVAGFCDYPENVDCSDRGGPNKIESMEENASCPTPYGSYRSSTSCGIFYICNNGIPFKFDCPVGLNYNTELGVCDYPYRVDCGGTPSERPEPEPPVPEFIGENVGEELTQPDSAGGEKHKYYGGLKQVPANLLDSRVPCRSPAVFRLNPSCSSVAVCRNGYSTVINCATGTAWDSGAQKCINVYQARC